ncbi:VOC family protein [Streptomyces sp. NRRL F-2664]|uniref:VOC family protein n=1 Tax=Streptomyces sp. NRRL F-2664 TaxID=1463842 RepID=UPI0004CAA28C|nr:VOC family protein [Streptomyces sp. NRRL F-2664]
MTTNSRDVFGVPCWVNLAAPALADVEEFYAAVLGWTFRATRLGEDFRVALLDGRPVASVGALTAKLGVPTAWTPYFAVEDAEVTAARIRERGATMAVGPLAFATGRAALAADPYGAVFGFWEGEVVQEWHAGEEGAAAWVELRTRDAFAAAVFYGEVLDWACERPGCCDVTYEDDHVVVRRGSRTVARIDAGAVENASDAQIRPRWHVHFAVADLDGAVDRAQRHGGAAVTPVRTSPTDRRVTLRDGTGALFTVIEAIA